MLAGLTDLREGVLSTLAPGMYFRLNTDKWNDMAVNPYKNINDNDVNESEFVLTGIFLCISESVFDSIGESVLML